MSAEANKELVRRLAVEPWEGNLQVIDEVVAPNYVGHVAGPDLQGVQGLKDFVNTYRTAFPDGKILVEGQFTDGDQVATRWTGRGTQTGELLGIPPSGKQVTVTGITVSQLAGGKVVEEWISWDQLGMLQQLGVISELAAGPKEASG